MSTLSEIDPDVCFRGLEPLICDAVDMVDVLVDIIDANFNMMAPKGEFVLSAEEGHRLFFLAGIVLAMSQKVRDAYYVAWDNEKPKHGGEARS